MASSTQSQKTIDVSEAIKEIESLKDEPGKFGHNIVSCILRMIAKEHGYEFTNEIVERHELDHYFAITKYYTAKKALREHSRSAR